MNTITIPRQEALIHLESLPNAKRRLTISPKIQNTYIHVLECVTAYDETTINAILKAKGAAYLCDEIAREEDSSYIQPHVTLTVTSHIDPEMLAGKRLMDFGCGCGASTVILSRLLPKTEIWGVELSVENLEAAKARIEFYGLNNVTLLQSPSGDQLPEGIGMFDAIMLPAVYEHLLPNERKTLLPLLWSHLKPDGILFLDETPWRWFPIETHTTGLPFINYFPDRIAHWYATKFSSRANRSATWHQLLRDGIRGGTFREILNNIGSPGSKLEPTREGIKNAVDLWAQGYALPSKGLKGVVKRITIILIRAISVLTGIAVVPYLSIAIRKPK